MEFKIGNKVRVIRKIESDIWTWVGEMNKSINATGTIASFSYDENHITLYFDDKHINDRCGGYYYHIEAIKRICLTQHQKLLNK